jgi:hypothetical protein
MPSVAQTPIDTFVERMNCFTSPDNSILAPAFVRPISNEAPGIGRIIVKDDDHVLPILRLDPKRDAHTLYPTLAGDAHGNTHADAPIEI